MSYALKKKKNDTKCMSVMYYTYLNDMKLYMDHRPKYLNKIVLYCIVLYCIVLYCIVKQTRLQLILWIH